MASGIASAGYSNPEQLNVNLPVASPAGQLALTLINLGSGNLVNLELSALEADTLGKVVSRPRVVTADNQKAHIEQGTEIPYIIAGTNNTVPTVEFKNAVLSLDVTPQITPDNHIIMKVEVRDDTVGQTIIIQGSEYPAIDTKSVTTQIAVNNGDTAVIGGIYQETVNNNVTKVPLLGDIPDSRLSVQADFEGYREDRTADLPHPARGQGIGHRGTLGGANSRLRRG